MAEPLTRERDAAIRDDAARGAYTGLAHRDVPVLLAEIDRLREAVRLAAELLPINHDEACLRRFDVAYRCRCDHGDRVAWLAEYGGAR